jgi:TonB family protein
VLGVVAKPVSSESAQPAPPKTPASAFDADLSGLLAPIGDGGIGIGSIGTFGTGMGLGRARSRTIVAMPLGSHGVRAMAVAKGACGKIEELRACHDDAGRPVGTVILDLSIDAAGKATVSKTSGELVDEKLRTCVSTALASAVFDPAAAGSTSYSIAFEGTPGKEPMLRDSKVTATGGLPPEIITRVIRSRMAQIRYCYEKALKVDPKTAGKITVSFTIDPKGAVTGAKAASSTLGDATLDACIVSVFTKITFPAPASGSISVSYPIVLSTP